MKIAEVSQQADVAVDTQVHIRSRPQTTHFILWCHANLRTVHNTLVVACAPFIVVVDT